MAFELTDKALTEGSELQRVAALMPSDDGDTAAPDQSLAGPSLPGIGAPMMGLPQMSREDFDSMTGRASEGWYSRLLKGISPDTASSEELYPVLTPWDQLGFLNMTPQQQFRFMPGTGGRPATQQMGGGVRPIKGFSREQTNNANIIAGVGKSLGASDRDIIIALMTSMQESNLRNLSYGDRDSVGLFQQRNAWGSFGARTNPAEAARMFFQGGRQGQRGLFDFRNRNGMSLTRAAQSVQVSAFPNAYAKWESAARSMYQGGGDGFSMSGGGRAGGTSGRRQRIIDAAYTALGTPYRWGGNSLRGGVDCSGLIQQAFKAGGIGMPRVSYQQANSGQRISLNKLQPGDLVAWDNSSRNNGADHIALYIGNGRIIEAARPGTRVRISGLYDTRRAWGVRLPI